MAAMVYGVYAMSAMCLAMDPKFELDSQVVERIYLGYQNSVDIDG
jgi:hypothetical protein